MAPLWIWGAVWWDKLLDAGYRKFCVWDENVSHDTVRCYVMIDHFIFSALTYALMAPKQKTYTLKCNEMGIIMSIRENRSVMTNAMALRQSSSNPLMCASPIWHACRPDEMYTRSVLIYSNIFNTNRESSKMHLYWSWTKSVTCYSMGK